jgi:hypothetical protein
VGKQDDALSSTTRRFFVIYVAQKIGLHCRKFHHAFLSQNAERSKAGEWYLVDPLNTICPRFAELDAGR